MKKHLLLAGIALAVSLSSINAQTFDLEAWEMVDTADDGSSVTPYENVVSPFLRTLNEIHTYPSNPPLTGFKEGNAHGGQFCAKLVAATVPPPVGIFVPGVLGTLNPFFNANGFGTSLNIPYSGRPANLKAWIKYTPVAGDSGQMFAYILKQNGGGFDTLGRATKTFYQSISSWTEQVVPFTYTNGTDAATHISLVFVTSKDYDFSNLANCHGQNNSTMYVDDVSLDGYSGISEMLFSGEEINVYPNPSSSIVNISVTQNVSNAILKVVDMNGRQVSIQNVSGTQFSVDVNALEAGNYIIMLQEGNMILGRKTFVKK